jgi:hypothetical protein
MLCHSLHHWVFMTQSPTTKKTSYHLSGFLQFSLTEKRRAQATQAALCTLVPMPTHIRTACQLAWALSITAPKIVILYKKINMGENDIQCHMSVLSETFMKPLSEFLNQYA